MKKVNIFILVSIFVVAIAQLYILKVPHKIWYALFFETECNDIDFDTNFYDSTTKCINLESLAEQKYIPKEAVENGDNYSKITGLDLIGDELLVTLNSGYLLYFDTINNYGLKKTINLRTPEMTFDYFSGVISSVFIDSNEFYLYYTANFQSENLLIVDHIIIKDDKILTRNPMILTNEQFENSDLGGAFVDLDHSLLLAIGKGVSELTGDATMRLQQPNSVFGKTIMIPKTNWSGTTLNPFGKLSFSIRTLGHKNPQGAFRDQYDNIFMVEHGPNGGDEINVIHDTGDYGYSKFSYGYDNVDNKYMNEYNPNYIDPIWQYTPSPAISDIADCPFTSGGGAIYHQRCMLVTALYDQSLNIMKFKPIIDSTTSMVLNKTSEVKKIISWERIEVGERVRRVATAPLKILLGTDMLNIYINDYLPR